jgi:biopolymer transport protein TolR
MQTYKGRRRKPMAEINIVPYIDVMLVLLVIFMITAPLLTQGVQVNLPQAAAKPLESKQKEPIIISVDAQGNYFLNINANPDQAMDPKAIADRVSVELQASKQSGQERQVLVKGDQSVDYGKIVQAMVLLQQAGAQTVGLMTKPPES